MINDAHPYTLCTKTESIMDDFSPYHNVCQGTQKRVLFVCSAGMLRSPTAAVIGAQMGFNTRSCGSWKGALIPISERLITWADYVVFMQQENYRQAQNMFYGQEIILDLAKKSKIWDIEDNYNYMDYSLCYTLKYYMQQLEK